MQQMIFYRALVMTLSDLQQKIDERQKPFSFELSHQR